MDIITIDNWKLCIEVCVASFCAELLKLLMDLDDILCINSLLILSTLGKGPPWNGTNFQHIPFDLVQLKLAWLYM